MIISSLNNLRLSMRIGLLVGLALLGLGGMTGVYLVSDANIQRSFQAEETSLIMKELAVEIKIGSLQLRRREKDFLLRKDMKYVEKHAKAGTAFEAALGDLENFEAAAPIMPQITALRGNFTRYARQFELVVALRQELGLSEEEGLEGQLRLAVKAAEAALNEAGLDALEQFPPR